MGWCHVFLVSGLVPESFWSVGWCQESFGSVPGVFFVIGLVPGVFWVSAMSLLGQCHESFCQWISAMSLFLSVDQCCEFSGSLP